MNMFNVRTAVLAALMAVLGTSAFAQTWDETAQGGGDAGDLVGTGQTLAGTGALTEITGDLPSTTDRDVFKIFITTAGTFSATTDVTPGTNTDTQLRLFTADGYPIAYNDDDGAGFLAFLSAGNALYNTLPAGEYLIVVSNFDSRSTSVGGDQFPATYNGVQAPTGPGGSQPLTGWTGTPGGSGTYRITLAGCSFVPAATGNPEIDVRRAGVSIGHYVTLGAVTLTTQTVSLTIANTSATTTLNVTSIGAGATGVGSCTANTTALTPASPVATSGTATFDVQLTPLGGSFECTVTISNSDSDEGTYLVVIRGTAPPANDLVAGAIVLTLNRAVAGSLVNAANDYQIQAGSASFTGIGQTVSTAPGRDLAYTFTAPAAGNYSFRVHFTGGTSNWVTYLLNAAPAGTPPVTILDAGIILASNRNTNTTNASEELFNVALTASQQVFLIVDENLLTTGNTFIVEVINCVVEAAGNDNPATAGAFTNEVEGSITPAGDFDYYNLGTPAVGSRVFAMLDAAASNPQDFYLRVTTATDTLEWDDDGCDTPFGGLASVVAGTPLTGVQSYLQVKYLNNTATTEPYRLYSVVQGPSAGAISESEPNDTLAQANLAASNYFTGTLLTAGDIDMYRFNAQAGDLIFIGLDLDPTRTNLPINGALALLDSTGNVLVSVADGGSTSSVTTGAGSLTSTTPNSPAEGLVFRAITAGTYYTRVTYTSGTVNRAYLLSISKNGQIGGGSLVVTNLNDSGAGSLRDAVTLAQATLPGNDIVFATGLTGTIVFSTEIAINKPLTITGPTGSPGITLSGNAAVRVFHIGLAAPSQASTVVLSNLAILDGRAAPGSGFGGGIRIGNALMSATLNNVSFTGCQSAAASGGGLQCSFGATATCNNCTFTNNSAPGGNGAGASIQFPTTFNNCTFTGNSALVGGAVQCTNLGTLTMSGCTISGNTATNAAGGILVVAGNGLTHSITGCTISGNTSANASGLLVSVAAATTSVTNITNSTFSGNNATGALGGAALAISSTAATANGTLNLTNCTLSGNTAVSATSGSSIHAESTTAGGVATVNYANTIISGAGTVNIGSSGAGTANLVSQNNNLCTDATGNLTQPNDLPSTAANLGALANNGGPTQTHMPQPNSAAIDKGRAITGITSDQRGTAKPIDSALITNASNGDGSDIGSVEAPPVVNIAPTITSAAPANGLINTAYNHTYTATGTPATFTFTVTSGALPTGLTLSAAGVISGTPTVSGNFTGDVTCSNGISPDAVQSFNIDINEAPAITSANSTTFTVGTAGNFNFTATGFPATFTWTTVSTLPTGVTLTSGGVLGGTPAVGTGGTYVLAIVCSNGVASDANQSFTLTVNEAPDITSTASTTFIVGTAGTFTHTATGFPVAMTFTNIGVALPTGVTLTAGGVLSGTPAAGTGGTYALIINANNGITPDDQQNFTLTVNEAPTITSAAPASPAVQGAAYNHTYTATGFPATFTFTVTSGALPTGLSLSGAGVISGNATATGVFTGTVSCSNGVGTDATQNFSITIVPPGPNIAVSTLNLTLSNTTQGVAGSPSVTYTVGGTNLTNDIVLAAPTNVEISLVAGGPYSAGFTLTQTGGTVATTTIHARITAGAPQGAVSGNITHTSTGATQRDVAVTGTVAPPVPDINIQRAGTDIADGTSDAQGTVPFGIAQVVTYTIQNTGLGGLTITASPLLVNITGTPGNCTASVTTQPTSGSIPAAGSLTFVITYTVTTAAAFNFDVQIVSNDPDAESTYDFQVLGTGGSVPEINVSRTGAIADGGTDALGNNVEGTAIVLTYSIANAGNSALTITPPVTLTGLVNCTATLTTAPGVSVAAAGSTPMVITVTPLAAGAFSCVVTIINDDADEGTYNWTISGTGTSSGGGGGGGGGDGGGGCSTGESNSLWMLAGVMAALGLALRLRRKLA